MAILSFRRYREPMILRPLPTRPRSRSAGWALRVAVFAPILAIVSIVAHRSGFVDTPTFLVLAGCVAAVGLLGLFLIFVAMRSLWSKGTKGGRQAIWALFFTILTLTPFVFVGIGFFAYPYQNDVSTDLVDPPLLAVETRLSQADPQAIAAGRLHDGYPGLTGRRYKAPPDAIEATILEVAEAQGWTLLSRRGRLGADDEMFFEFSYMIPVIGIPGSIVLRLTDEGDTSFIDMRARMDFVPHDLGWNARLIEAYLKALDFELIGIVEA
ncbi:MAG: DUF1499 domain-containing protein [Oricola sp.]